MAKVEYQIDIINVDYFTSSDAYEDVGDEEKQIIQIDNSASKKFVNPTYYFEAVLRGGAIQNAKARLYNVTDGAAVSGSEVTVTTDVFARARSGAITLPTDEAKEYKIQIRTTVDGYVIHIRAARIIVVDDVSAGWTKGEEQVEIGDSTSHSDTTWTTITNHPIYKYESAKRDGTVTIYFEATIYGSQAGKTYAARLYNKTDGVEVTDSEVQTTETTPDRARSAAITLTDGKEYVVQIKNYTSGKTVYLTGAKIIIQQSGTITKTQLHKKTAIYWTYTDTSYVELNNEVLYDKDNLPPSLTIYYQPVLKVTSGYTAYSELYDIDTPASVSGSEKTTTSTSYVLLRSGSISLTDDKQHDSRVKVTSGGTYYISAAWIVIDAQLVVPPVEIYPTFSLRGRGGDARRKLSHKRSLKLKKT